MVQIRWRTQTDDRLLSVLALSSRFDGRYFQGCSSPQSTLSVLALSSRFDGHPRSIAQLLHPATFSTRSVESF